MEKDSAVCSRCKEERPASSFYLLKTGSLSSRCKKCSSEHYYENKEKISYNKSILDRQQIINDIIQPIKAKGCTDCAQVFIPEAMEFDHVGEAKNYTIAKISRLSVSVEEMTRLLNEELELCEVCCGNCHRIRTSSRYQNSARRDFLEGNYTSKLLNEKKLYVYNLLQESGCTDCQIDNLLVLELDHVVGVKSAKVSSMLQKARYSLTEVKSEVGKCVVRCVVCHRIKTVSRNQGLEETQQTKTWKLGAAVCSCGARKDRDAIQCVKCHRQEQTVLADARYPELEELILGVETYGWAPYARKLGVLSDNGLRKLVRRSGVDPKTIQKKV